MRRFVLTVSCVLMSLALTANIALAVADRLVMRRGIATATSGNAAMRLSVVTATPFSLPARMCGSVGSNPSTLS